MTVIHEPACVLHEQRAELAAEIKRARTEQDPHLDVLLGAWPEFWGGGDQEVEGCSCKVYAHAPRLEVGLRVRLREDVERYPHFIAPKGSTGTVVRVGTDLVAVRLDAHLDGAEEWENEVQWIPENGDDAWLDLEEHEETLAERQAAALADGDDLWTTVPPRTPAPEVESNQPDERGVRPDGSVAVFGESDWDELAEERRLSEGEEVDFVVSAGHAEYGEDEGLCEEIWNPTGDEDVWQQILAASDDDPAATAERLFVERHPDVEVGEWDLSWEHVWRVHGTRAEVEAWFDGLLGGVETGPEGGDDDTYDYWPSLVRMTDEVAAALGGDRQERVKTAFAEALEGREMTADDFAYLPAWAGPEASQTPGGAEAPASGPQGSSDVQASAGEPGFRVATLRIRYRPEDSVDLRNGIDLKTAEGLWGDTLDALANEIYLNHDVAVAVDLGEPERFTLHLGQGGYGIKDERTGEYVFDGLDGEVESLRRLVQACEQAAAVEGLTDPDGFALGFRAAYGSVGASTMVDVEIPFEGGREALRLDGSPVRPLPNTLLALADMSPQEVERVLRGAVVLYAAGAGTVEQCLDTAMVWECG